MNRISSLMLALVLALSLAQGQQQADQLAEAAKSGDAVALQKLTAMAKAGNVIAQNNLGNMYYLGDGIPQDLGTAILWYRKAAEQGLALAQFYLGSMYQNGEGLPPDSRLAAQWYRKAAVQGLADAQYALGWMYENSEGVPNDLPTAAQWYRKAAVQGLADAEFALGTMYCNGDGVPQDPEAARQWYSKAAKHGNKDAVVETQNLSNCQRIGLATLKLEVHFKKVGGVLLAPVSINGRISLDFVVDSGAADVSLPADVVMTLMRTGTLTAADFTGSKTYVLADGSEIPSRTLRIRSLQVGGMVLYDVSASVAPTEGSLLLGQSFLSRLKSWSIDNTRQVLVLGPKVF